MLQCYYRQILGMVQYCCGEINNVVTLFIGSKSRDDWCTKRWYYAKRHLDKKIVIPPFQIYHYILKYKIFQINYYITVCTRISSEYN